MKTSRPGFLLLITASALSILAFAQTPYPAFVVVDDLPDVFIAGLPGVRAKQLAGDPRTRRSSNRVILPADWSFTTGASPGQSIEIFVLAGQIELGGFPLHAGGYVYMPPGFTGAQLKTTDGAAILYFLDEPDSKAVIQTPIILDSDLLEWLSLDGSPNVDVKELRTDPGSGHRTWLLRSTTSITNGWQQSQQTAEGYLWQGSYVGTECVDGKIISEPYETGGYFYRPYGAIHGGADAGTETMAIWFIRVPGSGKDTSVDGCPSA